MNTRSIVLDMLIRINEEGLFCHLVMRETLAKLGHLKPHDRAFVKRLTLGTLENQIRIDSIINLFARTKTEQMKPLIRNLMRMSVYQICFLDSIPDHAACDEAVKLAARRGFSSLKGFINGVLRNIARDKKRLNEPDETEQEIDSPIVYLSGKYSMPKWLIEMWLEDYRYEKLKLILQSFLEIRPVTLRWHRKYQDDEAEEWMRKIKASGVDIHPHPLYNNAYELSDTDEISNLPGFKEGLFTVQDVSSMYVCEAADIKPEDVVVDVCAAPGGKALHAASLAKMVFARDISESKCNLIRENAIRLRQANLEIAVHDATSLDSSLIEKADVLLADLPCSGLGVIGRKPDIKYKVSPESIQALCDLQRRILSVVWQYVKPGGVLIYSTCTMSRDENENMMEWFVENFPFSYAPLPFILSSPEGSSDETQTGILRLLPGIHRADGFFICRLKRNE